MRKNITKSLSLLALLVLLSLAGQAQGRFDWAKSYKGASTSEGQTNRNTVIDSDVDSEGNLYILGEFTRDAQINGTDLLPSECYARTVNVVIAKLSPAGELLWHKAIHSNKDNYSHGTGIQVVGDTSVVCMATVVYPSRSYSDSYTYFLDTLITNSDTSFFPTDSVSGYCFGAYLAFDLDGELKERHFLSAAIIYADGTAMMHRSDSTRYEDQVSGANAFTIDSDGNIIMIRTMNVGIYDFSGDEYYGYRILIDGGVRHIDVPVPTYTPNTNYQLLKFSPHFNRLLHHQVLFEPNADLVKAVIYTESLMLGEDNAIYLLVNITPNSVLWLDSIDFRVVGLPDGRLQTNSSLRYSFQIKYDSLLQPVRIFQLDYENPGNVEGNGKTYTMPAQSMDENGDVYILGSLWAKNEVNVYADTFSLDVRRGIFFVRMDGETGEVLSVGEARSSDLTDISDDDCDHHDIVTKNNRVMAQLSYKNDIQVGDSTITADRPNAYFAGLYVWDKEGNELQFIDYSSCGGTTIDYNSPRGAVLHDSILYLTGRLNGGGTFGDHTLPTGDRAFMVKYVDPAFATPYVHQDQDTNVGIADTAPQTLLAYPNPTTGKVTIDMGAAQPVTTAYLTDMLGRTVQTAFTATGQSRYTIDLTARPHAVYLLTLVTQDGNRHAIKLLKQGGGFSK